MLSVFTVIEPEFEVLIVSEVIVPLTETTCVVTGCGFSFEEFESASETETAPASASETESETASLGSEQAVKNVNVIIRIIKLSKELKNLFDFIDILLLTNNMIYSILYHMFILCKKKEGPGKLKKPGPPKLGG